MTIQPECSIVSLLYGGSGKRRKPESSGLPFCLREWLSGGVLPCQGRGRGFDSRLALPVSVCAAGFFHFILNEEIPPKFLWNKKPRAEARGGEEGAACAARRRGRSSRKRTLCFFRIQPCILGLPQAPYPPRCGRSGTLDPRRCGRSGTLDPRRCGRDGT